MFSCSYCSSARATSRNPAAEVLLRSHVTLLRGKVVICTEYKPPYTRYTAEYRESSLLDVFPFTWALCWSAGLCSASWLRCRPCCCRSGPLFSGRCCCPGRWPTRCLESAGASLSGTETGGPGEGEACASVEEGVKLKEINNAKWCQEKGTKWKWNLLQSDVTTLHVVCMNNLLCG